MYFFNNTNLLSCKLFNKNLKFPFQFNYSPRNICSFENILKLITLLSSLIFLPTQQKRSNKENKIPMIRKFSQRLYYLRIHRTTKHLLVCPIISFLPFFFSPNLGNFLKINNHKCLQSLRFLSRIN